jgi:peptide/nickel transport system permease protein
MSVASLESSELIQELKHRSLWADVWIQFRKHKLAMLGVVILGIMVVAVLFGPLIYTVDPEATHPEFMLALPGAEHPFGTDLLGRDMLARSLFGGRISLAVGISAMLIAMIFGSIIGALAGFFPKLDGPLMRFTDMMLALPQLPLLLVFILLFRDTLRSLLGPETGIFLLVVTIIGVLGWMPTARVVRAQVLAVKEEEFITAARSIGTREYRILGRHIFPNILSPIMVAATLGVANAILTESTLSFLGLGFPSDFATWGRLVVDGRDFMTLSPFLVVWPGLFISLSVLSVNFIGDGLRDALDPRQRGK